MRSRIQLQSEVGGVTSVRASLVTSPCSPLSPVRLLNTANVKTTFRRPRIAIALVCALVFTATIARADDPLPSWNDGPAKQSIIDFVDEGHEGRLAGFRAGPRTHRRVRQRRHALERTAGAGPVLLRGRPREGARAAASRVEDQGAVRLAAQGRCESGARRRRPRAHGTLHGHAHRHDHRRVCADRQGLDRHRETSDRPASASST